MKHRLACAVTLLMGTALTGCSDRLILQTSTSRTPELRDVKRVAVVDFAGEHGQAVADLITISLMQADYEVVERDQLRDIVRELQVGKMDLMSLSDEEKAQIFGRILNADVILTGQVVRKVIPFYEKEDEDHLVYESATLEIAARAFDARTGKVFWTAVVNGTATAKNGRHLRVLDYINEPCRELVYSLRNPKYEDIAEVFEGAEIVVRREERGF
ncbi:MAG: hypothetical protein JXB13_13850 [Phycisphaerae bacterium]|nr:hypothetical protein [Phycisphaerae bacterium]